MQQATTTPKHRADEADSASSAKESNPPKMPVLDWFVNAVSKIRMPHYLENHRVTFPFSPTEIRQKLQDAYNGIEPRPNIRFRPSRHPMDNDKPNRLDPVTPPACNGRARVKYTISGYATLRRENYHQLNENASATQIARAEVEILDADPWSVLDMIVNADRLEITVSMEPEAAGT